LNPLCVGTKLRQERLAGGLTLEDISRATKVSVRYLEAIETDDFERLPGLIFTRNFVRQYALTLKLDPDPLLSCLPKQDESTVRLPDLPERPRSYSSSWDPRFSSIVSSTFWLTLAIGAAIAAYVHFNQTGPTHTANTPALIPRPRAVEIQNATAKVTPPIADQAQADIAPAVPAPEEKTSAESAEPPVQVIVTAHQTAWLQVTVDGKSAFTGTLQANESRQVSAAEQVKIIAGNAGALTISLNGKELAPIGTVGQVRVVRLTAEGPEFLSRVPPRAPDPL